MPAEIVAAYCEYVRRYLTIVEDDPTLDALYAARAGEPDEWVRWAGPGLIAAATRLSQHLVTWSGGETPELGRLEQPSNRLTRGRSRSKPH